MQKETALVCKVKNESNLKQKNGNRDYNDKLKKNGEFEIS